MTRSKHIGHLKEWMTWLWPKGFIDIVNDSYNQILQKKISKNYISNELFSKTTEF